MRITAMLMWVWLCLCCTRLHLGQQMVWVRLAIDALVVHACRQQHLLATSQLQSMAKLLEDAAAGRYKRAVDPATAAAAAAVASMSEGGADPAAADAATAAAPDSKQLVLAELTKTSTKHHKLVEVLQGLQQQMPSLQDDLSKVLLHAATTSAWLQPTAAAAVTDG